MNLQTRLKDRAPPAISIDPQPAPAPLCGAQFADFKGVPGANPLERRRFQCYLVLVLYDLFALAVGFWLAGLARYGDILAPEAWRQLNLIAPIFLTFALYNGSYSVASLASTLRSAARVVKGLLTAAGLMLLIAFFTKTGADYSRLTLGIGVLCSGCAMVLGRLGLPALVRWRCGVRVENLLILEDGGPFLDFPNAIRVDAAKNGLRPDAGDPYALDLLSRWFAPMDRVIISCVPSRRQEWALVLKSLSVDGEIIDDVVAQLGALGARTAGGSGLLQVSHRPLSLRDRFIKRAFDLALTIPALVILSPFLLAIALLIKIEDRGSALFVQIRTGRANRLFRMYKFRSMRSDQSDADGSVSTSRADARITRVGRFIRRTSIDELPQLLNVLSGEMSLVGPRPHAIGSLAGDKMFWEVDRRYSQRHALKPGLTGLAQVRGYRGATVCENDLVNRLQSDLEYLDCWTIWRDIGILVATARVMVHDRAY